MRAVLFLMLLGACASTPPPPVQSAMADQVDCTTLYQHLLRLTVDEKVDLEGKMSPEEKAAFLPLLDQKFRADGVTLQFMQACTNSHIEVVTCMTKAESFSALKHCDLPNKE